MAKAQSPLITLTTDFGHQDGYVGIVKGVVASIAPAARLVDLSHEVTAFDIRAAAWIINNAYRHFPKGTVHLVVVDPGVGSDKQRGIALSAHDQFFVAPDNGVLSYILDREKSSKAHALTNNKYFLADVSSTFHGRDIYGPVAAHLATGEVDIKDLGPVVDIGTLTHFVITHAKKSARSVGGQVVYIDRFGNLVTNILAEQAKGAAHCYLDGKSICKVSKTYSSGAKGEAVAFVASHGYLEIAVSQGRACDELKAGMGASVRLDFE